jgi:ectoine hydroxylase-related dioxygenase (phytanoyl-CoA dioxygenase family)
MEINFSQQETADVKLAEGTLADSVSLFRECGALLIRDAFPKELLAGVAQAFAQKYLSLSKKKLRKRDAIVGDRRYMVTIDIKKPFNDPALYANPLLLELFHSLLTVHCRLASFGAVVAWPDAEDQAIHLDHPPLFENASICDAMSPYAITVVVPLVDMTEEMGTTAIWPGTHRNPDRLQTLRRLMERPNYDGAEKPITNLGDAYLMDYRVIHGGLANRSENVRPILYMVYSRPWFRDGFNFSSQPSLQISKKQLKKVPEIHQGLFRGNG